LLSVPWRGRADRYWPLNAASGTVARNRVADGTPGTLIGDGVAWTNDAQRGQVLSFRSSSNPTNYVDAGFVPMIGIYSNFTWSFWPTASRRQQQRHLGNRYDSTNKVGSQDQIHAEQV
jgi:hypothetical protein